MACWDFLWKWTKTRWTKDMSRGCWQRCHFPFCDITKGHISRAVSFSACFVKDGATQRSKGLSCPVSGRSLTDGKHINQSIWKMELWDPLLLGLLGFFREWMCCKMVVKTQNIPVEPYRRILDPIQSITSDRMIKRHSGSQRRVLRFEPCLQGSSSTCGSYSPAAACRNWAPVWTIAGGLSHQILFISKYLIPCEKAVSAAGWLAGRPLSGKQEVQRGAAAICGPHTFPQQTAAVRDAAWAVMQPANCHRLLIYSAWFAVRKK